MQETDSILTSGDPNILFMIGSGRCGSSLIHEILARHQDVGFISNIDDRLPTLNLKGRYNNALLRSPLGRFTKKGRIRFAPSEAYHLISRQLTPIYMHSQRNLSVEDVSPDLRDGFRHFFAERYAAQRKPLFAHKYTGWGRVAFFREIFPQARFLHIVRDGRAVANSFLQMKWWSGFNGPENWSLGQLSRGDQAIWDQSDRSVPVLAGLAWKILVESIEQDAATIGQENIKTIRYEDFLLEPEHVIADICTFSGVDWSEDFREQMRKSPIKPGREKAYKADMPAEQLQKLENAITPKLEKYGYLENR